MMTVKATGSASRSRVLAVLLGVLALTIGGCATHRLQPAPEAQRVPGQPLAAVSADGGVRVVAQPEAWRGAPQRLDRKFTPMKRIATVQVPFESR